MNELINQKYNIANRFCISFKFTDSEESNYHLLQVMYETYEQDDKQCKRLLEDDNGSGKYEYKVVPAIIIIP